MMTNKDKYRQAFAPLHPSGQIHLEEKPLKQFTKAILLFRTATALLACVILLLGCGTVAYAADIGGFRQTIQAWIHGKLTDVNVVEQEPGHYAYSYDGGEGTVVVGGGVAIEPDGSQRPLSAQEVAEGLSSEVCTKEDGTVWLYYESYAINITRYMGETGCRVVLDDQGEKHYFDIAFPDGITGSCGFSRSTSVDDPENYTPIN